MNNGKNGWVYTTFVSSLGASRHRRGIVSRLASFMEWTSCAHFLLSKLSEAGLEGSHADGLEPVPTPDLGKLPCDAQIPTGHSG